MKTVLAYISVLAISLLLVGTKPAEAKVVEYNLVVENITVNKANDKNIQAIAVNGQIPGPTLYFTEGDKAVIHVTNKLKKPTTIHWHGLLVPANMDGVPYVSFYPIEPGETFTYTFPIKQAGTYWYHSHWNLQEQLGHYGSIVIHPKRKRIRSNRDYVIVFSDWTNQRPKQVLRNLKKEDDYYAVKKDTVASWTKALKLGVFGTRLRQAAYRMVPLGLSDVGYDAFLANGEPLTRLGPARAGQRIRLRLINGSTSSYFNMEYAGGEMEVVAADGKDVAPFKVKRLMMGIAETYDVIVRPPDNRAYEFRATAIDGSGFSSAILGDSKEVVAAPDIGQPNPLLLQERLKSPMMQKDFSTNKTKKLAAIPKIYDSYLKTEANYGKLRSVHRTTLNPKNPVRTVKLTLTGNMANYLWSFNGKILSEADLIKIRKGETVRFEFTNKTMMNHPLHLHGHFFRVLNGQGNYAPLKHTVNVPPKGKLTIEFDANEEKDWFFHCHILYHLVAGMARVVQYEDNPAPASLLEAGKKDKREIKDTDWYFLGQLALMSQMSQGVLRGYNSRNAADLTFENDYKGAYDFELVLERRLTKFFKLITGGRAFSEDDQKIYGAIFGIRYTLPFWIDFQAYIDTTGHYRISGGSEIQITKRLQLNWEVNTDPEVDVQLQYRFTKLFGILASYNTDFGPGGGITLNF